MEKHDRQEFTYIDDSNLFELTILIETNYKNRPIFLVLEGNRCLSKAPAMCGVGEGRTIEIY